MICKWLVGSTVEITESRHYCWFPSIHQFSTGEIMATMRMSPDEVNPEGDFSAYCISKDGGLTWSRRYPMGAGANVDGALQRRVRSRWQYFATLRLGRFPVHGSPPTTASDFNQVFAGGMEFTGMRDIPVRASQPIQLAHTDRLTRKCRMGIWARSRSFVPWGPIIDGSQRRFDGPGLLQRRP